MTELIWDGKYDQDGKKVAPLRVALPFQTVETVNESAQERQRVLDMFSTGRDPEWRNRLIWGDKKYVLPALLQEFAGQVDLIYIDPPFDTGTNFSFQVQVDGEEFTRAPNVIEMKAYRDIWSHGLDSYLHWLYESFVILHDLLAPTGSIFVHLGSNVSAYARPLLSECFGEPAYTNEIVWKRSAAHSDIGQGALHLGRLHDVIYWYRMGAQSTVHMQYEPYTDEYIANTYKFIDADTGRRYASDNTSGPGGARKGNPFFEFRGVKKYWRYSRATVERLHAEGRLIQSNEGRDWRYKRYLDEMPGVPIQDVWLDIPPLQSQSAERTGYETQKPDRLLNRVIGLASNEGDLVLDCFVGSGTTAAVAEALGRRWIACDLSRFAVETTRKRILSLPEVKPFVVQNLGKYERQLWQAAEFGETAQQKLAAYRRFILDLYKATPITGYAWLHGLKGGRMVHVGAVDSPVTPADLSQIAAEFKKAVGTGKDAPKTNGVDVLGWDFAFELNEVAKQQAAQANIDVRFLRIPRDVMDKRAVDQGDVRFFELAALSIDVQHRGLNLQVALTDFVIPPDDVPEDVQKAITHWEQWIDYWAVDWDFKADTFHNQWQDYRTRKKRALQKSTTHTYDEPGDYTVVIKVIDILGNDTTKTVKVKVGADGAKKKAPARAARST
ncbi:MAG: DNA methyltransferase [Dehalococcoidia bacterium]